MEAETKLPARPVKVYEIDPGLKLTAKQAAFVYEYLKDYNATQAALRAGYASKSAHSIGCENLMKPEIAKAIDEGKWFYQYQNGIDADWIRKQMIDLYHRCIQAEPVMKFDHEEKRMVPTGEWVFMDKTAMGLLALMGKDVGMFKTEVNVNASGVVTHEHVTKQMDFETVRNQVDKHRHLRVVKS